MESLGELISECPKCGGSPEHISIVMEKSSLMYPDFDRITIPFCYYPFTGRIGVICRSCAYQWPIEVYFQKRINEDE